MTLSLESQWTVVACGVMAHADGVLDGQECDQLLALVEDEADAEDYSAWLSTISDAARLQEMLAQLPPPPETAHREILETAWTLAVADGERTAAEHDALERIAARLGVASVQLEFWRDAWTQGQHDLAELVADAACVVLAGSAPLSEDDRTRVAALLRDVPTTDVHREELAAGTVVPKDDQDVGRRLRAIPKRRRQWLVKTLAPLTARANRREDAQRRLSEIGEAGGLSAAILTSLMGG